MKLLAWIFMPTNEDYKSDWAMPLNYIPSAPGELRLKPECDTPMDDRVYQPGWKRLPHLDCEMPAHDQGAGSGEDGG